MALFFKKDLENGAYLALWKMEEPEDFFHQNLRLHVAETVELSKLKGRRRLEWLACRFLVHEMLTEHGTADRMPVLKDEYGKPHLWGTPFHLSFSHSHEMVAVLLARQPAGIDIQAFVPKIGLLAPKFMRPEEWAAVQEATRLAHLHFFWCAKEALYKAYGRKELDFRQHLLVEPFDYQVVGTTFGHISKDGFFARYPLFFEKMEHYFLVWTGNI